MHKKGGFVPCTYLYEGSCRIYPLPPLSNDFLEDALRKVLIQYILLASGMKALVIMLKCTDIPTNEPSREDTSYELL